MPHINFLIKPASSNCNSKCKYCFYHSIADNRNTASYGFMGETTLENIVKKGLEYADETCGFSFQGGEPTLIGIDFFRKLIELQKKYNIKAVNINNTIQINGLLIDEEWAKFLHDNNFLVGLSLDGPRDIHDLYRVNADLEGTFDKVMNAVAIFNKHKINYNILFVVTSTSARYANRIYNFLKQNDFKYVQFIPCLDPVGEEKGKQKYSLSSKDFERFLKITFDRWYEDFVKGDYISIRYFDNNIRIILGYEPEACSMVGRCQCQWVIEADGGIYPCDFYVFDEWKLGNINDEKIEDILNGNKLKKFIENSTTIESECIECKWFVLCRNGCKRERENFDIGKASSNYYCRAYKGFYKHAYPKMLDLIRKIQNRKI